MADPTISIIIDAYTRGLQDGMKQAQNSVKQASKDMTAHLADLNQAAMLVQRTFRGLTDIVGSIYTAGKEGADLADLERRFIRVSGGAEEAEANLEAMRRATKNTATDAELMAQGLNLLSSGLVRNREELETVTKTVAALGKAKKGFSADRSMFSYTMMISNGLQSVRMRADDFGISVTNVERRMKELEAEGYNTRDALQAAVNEDLLRVYELLGLGAETAADKMRQAETALANFADRGKKWMIPVSYQIAEGLTTLVNLFGATEEGIPRTVDALWLFMATAEAVLPTLEKGGLALAAWMRAWYEIGRGDFAAAAENFKEVGRHIQEIPHTIASAISETKQGYYEMYRAAAGATNETGQELDELARQHAAFAADVEKEMKKVQEAWNNVLVRNARWAADNAIRELRRVEDQLTATARQSENAALQAMRSLQDQQIAAARQMEAMLRQLAASIARAQAQAAQAQAAAARAYAKQKLEIERNYQRRLREIQASYEETAEDAIVRRDALALVRAQRQRDKELADAEREREEQKQAAKEAYEEQLKLIKEALAQQIAAAQEAFRQQQEDLQRSLQQQAEDAELAEERRIQDQEIALRRQEEDAQQSQQRRIQDQVTALKRELQDLANSLSAKIAAQRAYYNLVEAEYKAHLLAMQALAKSYTYGSAGTSYQHGTPYVPATGMYLLHKGEAVIPADKNRMNSVTSGDSGRTSDGVTLKQQFVFYGKLSASEKREYQQIAYNQAKQAIGDVLSGVS